LDGVCIDEVDELCGAEAENEIAFVGGIDADYLGSEGFGVLD
jgi:hypothetical protein